MLRKIALVALIFGCGILISVAVIAAAVTFIDLVSQV